ncbi:class II aldolase/adducin family protein [Rhizobium sp. ZW T2_16]|jgi:ribulose-5-phosphate 4-epimerase/fuculose-1-phosphate aldolase|uniref:class II aldolase/adducin family protein n=1 Tax=Rhizobium sp. ZW T2_16 TaxID=3378083 RepID=UPI0038523685
MCFRLTAYQIMRIGRLPLLPYFRPEDRKLADAVRQITGGHKAIPLANHGPIVSGNPSRTQSTPMRNSRKRPSWFS